MLWFINGTLVETLLIILMMGYLDCKEIQAVHSKGDQPGDFFGRNDAEAETPVLWPSHAKSWLIGKDSDAGRDWGQEEKGMTEDEMPGWHHPLDDCEFEWTLGVGDGQGGLACCDSWGRRVGHDWATELNWTQLTLSTTLGDRHYYYIHWTEEKNLRLTEINLNNLPKVPGQVNGNTVYKCICMECLKIVTMTLYARQQNRHRYKERLLDSVGEGKGGMIWENRTETCTLP